MSRIDPHYTKRQVDALVEGLSATYGAEAMSNPETPLAGATQELIDDALDVFSPTDSVKAFDIGATLSTARPSYAGIIMWLTSATTGVPLHAAEGDLIARYASVPIETVVWSDDFDRADGAVGSTPVGVIAWENASAGQSLTVASNKAAPSGSGTGAAYFVVPSGTNVGILRATISTQHAGFTGIVWCFSDVSNLMSLARVSSGDLTYRVVKRVAGVTTTVKATGVAMASGDVIECDTRVEGDMKVTINGVLVYRQTIDTAVSIDAAAKAGTKHGFTTGNVTSGINGRWNDASFSTGGI